ncbi:hypothetical protein ACFV0D_02415 [Streptomyces sp. NPDC059556]|uniref:hypothetical protein n=1 Tax=Streptomyces sp. NPDC059556 TaxID=3346863 RepID=UPI0036B522D3
MYALDENTALVVDSPGTTDERLSVLGPNGVAILELRQRPRPHHHGRLVRARRPLLLPHRRRPLPRPQLVRLPRTREEAAIPCDTTPVPVNRDVFFSAANPAGRPYAFRTTPP